MAKITDEFPHGQQLIDAGFTTTSKVEKASDEELLAVEGIGPAGLVAIRAASEPPVNDNKTAEVEPAKGEAKEAKKGEETPAPASLCSNPTCGREITASPCPYCGTV